MKQIIEQIKSCPAEKVLFLGIGNEARGDDGAGPYFISVLAARSARHKYKFLDCGTLPENFTGKIKALSPELIIFVDAANFGGKKGEIRELAMKEIDGVSASPHHLPLTVVAKFLSSEMQPAPRFIFVGVQHGSFEIGDGLDAEVSHALNNFIASIML